MAIVVVVLLTVGYFVAS